MAKDPAVLVYTSDFLTGTMFMTDEQVGIYTRLLFAQHQLGGMIDKNSFNARVGNHDIVRSKFIETDEGFFNERMMIEMEKRSKKSNNLSINAKQRWEKEKQKKSKSNAIAYDLNMQSEDENENEIVHEIKIELSENFNFENYKNVVTIPDKFLAVDWFETEWRRRLEILYEHDQKSRHKKLERMYLEGQLRIMLESRDARELIKLHNNNKWLNLNEDNLKSNGGNNGKQQTKPIKRSYEEELK